AALDGDQREAAHGADRGLLTPCLGELDGGRVLLLGADRLTAHVGRGGARVAAPRVLVVAGVVVAGPPTVGDAGDGVPRLVGQRSVRERDRGDRHRRLLAGGGAQVQLGAAPAGGDVQDLGRGGVRALGQPARVPLGDVGGDGRGVHGVTDRGGGLGDRGRGGLRRHLHAPDHLGPAHLPPP